MSLEVRPKYQAIYQTAKELFWKFGIKRVSIEEICKEAKVSKMTFYKFFPNKIELAKTIWTKQIDESLERFKEVVDSDMEFTDKIAALFQIKMEATRDISVEFITDVYKNPELGLQEMVAKSSEQSLEIFIRFLKDSQKKGHIRKGLKIEFIMYYFNQMSSMIEDANLVALYDHPQDLIMEAMNFLFYGVNPKKCE